MVPPSRRSHQPNVVALNRRREPSRSLWKLAALTVLIGLLSSCGNGSKTARTAPPDKSIAGDSCDCARLTAPIAVPETDDELKRWQRVGTGAASFLKTLHSILETEECDGIDAPVHALFREHDALLREWLDLRKSSCWHFDRWVSDEFGSDASAQTTVAKLRSCAGISEMTRRQIASVTVINTCR